MSTMNVRKLELVQQKYARAPVTMGDVNNDGIINILDVIVTVNYILSGQNPDHAEEHELIVDAMDINGDENINVLDVIALVNYIIEGS